MTVWDRACCIGYGLQARIDGLWHLLRGHDLRWRDCPDLWTGHTGCITCEKCPDTSIEDGEHVGLSIWCRQWNWIHWIGKLVCCWLGHSELRHPQKPGPNETWIDIEDKWYCYRCMADVGAPEADER